MTRTTVDRVLDQLRGVSLTPAEAEQIAAAAHARAHRPTVSPPAPEPPRRVLKPGELDAILAEARAGRVPDKAPERFR